RRKVRFRIVNGSNTRSYRLGLSNGQPLIQVGSDGGLLSQPASRPMINIAPAERIDVVVDFSSYPLGTNITLKNAFLTTDRNLNDVMQFRVLREERDDSFIPAQLRYVEPIPESL